MVKHEIKRRQKPDWLKRNLPVGTELFKLKRNLESKNLHTICQDARCPNLAECWGKNHATFLVMGDICSRNCKFCSVKSGKCQPLDSNEPMKILDMVNIMNLQYVVITSVTRDDLPDGGANHFANIVRLLKQERPQLSVEVLIPDFKGVKKDIDTLLSSKPDVLNHNLESVKSLYPKLNRKPENYEVSLQVLKYSRSKNFTVKSGIMVGLGETMDELKFLFEDLLNNGVQLLTIGQYLQPTSQNIPAEKYYTPEEFKTLQKLGEEMGFIAVESGPFVRSSYNAEEMFGRLKPV